MKNIKSIAFVTCLVCLPFLTGCPGGGGNSSTPSSTGTAVATLQGVTLSVVVTGGHSPFSSSGSYTFTQTSGNGTSGSYSLQGQGGVQSNVGTYTYSASGNIGTLTVTEQSGTLVNNTLTFSTTNSGTINTSSPPGSGPRNVGGDQQGTFTIN